MTKTPSDKTKTKTLTSKTKTKTSKMGLEMVSSRDLVLEASLITVHLPLLFVTSVLTVSVCS